MRIRHFTKKGVVIPVAFLSTLGFFLLNQFIVNIKEKSRKDTQQENQLLILEQEVNSLKQEISSVKDRLEENQQNFAEQFQEYKARTNTKIDSMGEKIYALNARADTSEKLGKKNSSWIDSVNRELIRKAIPEKKALSAKRCK